MWGRGEILIKGANVTSGYYMMPDKTKEVFSDDGWFQTGDIGQFLSDGSIRSKYSSRLYVVPETSGTSYSSNMSLLFYCSCRP